MDATDGTYLVASEGSRPGTVVVRDGRIASVSRVRSRDLAESAEDGLLGLAWPSESGLETIDADRRIAVVAALSDHVGEQLNPDCFVVAKIKTGPTNQPRTGEQ